MFVEFMLPSGTVQGSGSLDYEFEPRCRHCVRIRRQGTYSTNSLLS